MINIEISVVDVLNSEIIPMLPKRICECLELLPFKIKEQIHEIRLRAGQVLSLCIGDGEYPIDQLAGNFSGMRKISQEEILETLGVMSENSLYAFNEEIKAGFITIRGGHRIGIVGKAVCNSNNIQSLKNFSGLNIRVSRQITGSADSIVGFLFEDKSFINTLIVSPPRCGKTTILRDLVRQLSNGIPLLGIRGQTIGLVDERSEIAACYKGIPQNCIGIRTDVLDNCPKAEGIMMLLRSMGPEIIATDEIGSVEDAEAIMAALFSGVYVVATAHGRDLEDIKCRPGLKKLLKHHVFGRVIILSGRNGPGTIEAVYNGTNIERLDIQREESFDSNLPKLLRRSIYSRRVTMGRKVI